MQLIDKYYPEGTSLRHILLYHSRCVKAMALRICEHHPELVVDDQFVADAAMLHDIGIFECDAPSIECHGTEPYILHGRLGAELLRAQDPRLEPYARVCERHTGAGLTRKEIEEQRLPLPHEDFVPETLEEKIICYADKFYSKSDLYKEKSLEHVEKSLAKFGQEGLNRFKEWEKMFSL
jgi:uncharacterized protein